MKTALIINAAALATCLIFSAGCMVERDAAFRKMAPTPLETTVTEAPPPPRTEIAIPSPGPAYVWIPGHWGWQDHWIWIGGDWVIPPRPEAVWVAGFWARAANGYVWKPGHWR